MPELRFIRALFVFSLAILVLLELTAFVVVKNIHENRKQEYFAVTTKSWDEEFSAIVNSYRMVSSSIIEHIQRDKQIAALFKNVNKTGDFKKAHDELFAHYFGLFKENFAYGLNIFHFYDAKGNAIARFQKPSFYGDNVLGFRTTVREAYANKNSAEAFELGRYYNAYRFVYAVKEDGEILGGIELGFDESRLFQTLNANFGTKAYFATSLEVAINPDISSTPSFLSVDNIRFVHSPTAYSAEQLTLLKRLFEDKMTDVQEALEKKSPFAFSQAIDGDTYIVVIKPFFNQSSKLVGCMVTYERDKVLPSLQEDFYTTAAMSAIIILMLWGGAFVLIYRYQSAKTELLTSKLQQHILLENLAECVIITDRKNRCTYVNSRTLEVLGYLESEMIGKNLHELAHHSWPNGSKYPKEECRLNSVLYGKPLIQTEDWFFKKGNVGFPVDVSVSPLIIKEEISGLITIFQDISERKRSQAQLEEMNTELEASYEEARTSNTILIERTRELEELNILLKTSEIKLQSLLEESPIAVRIAKTNGQEVVFANQAYAELINAKLSSVVGQNPADYYASRETYEEILQRLASNEAIVNIMVQLNIPSFGTKWALASYGHFVYNKEDCVLGWFYDVTRQKELELSLQELVKAETEKRMESERMLTQQSKLAALGEMMNNIAHQWRQPLNALGIMVQDVPVAFEYDEIDEEYTKKFKDDSMQMINYMSQTIDDFRNFFRPDKEKHRFCVKESVEKAYNIFKESMRTLNIDVKIELPQYDTAVYGYASEFGQVVLNILSNAKDVLETKSGERFMSIKVSKEDKAVRLSICDNAGGVPENIIDKIYDPYFTTKHKAQGTGLGLYMSKMIIEQNMGGKLTVRNIADGACFEIELPPYEESKGQ